MSELDDLMEQAAAEGADIGDDEVEIDLSEAATFEAFEGDEPVEIVAATLKHSGPNAKTPGAPYLELKLRIIEGEHAKRILWTNINLTGAGAGFGIDKLEAFGAEDKHGERISKDNRKLFIPGLVGLKAIASCAPDKRPEYSKKVEVGQIKPYASDGDTAELK